MVAQISGVSGIGNFDSVSTSSSRPNVVDFSDSIFSGLYSPEAGNKEAITVDGKTYPIQQVDDSNPFLTTLFPKYREAVIVNGEQYDIHSIPNPAECGGTIRGVIIDGKSYKVHGQKLDAIS